MQQSWNRYSPYVNDCMFRFEGTRAGWIEVRLTFHVEHGYLKDQGVCRPPNQTAWRMFHVEHESFPGTKFLGAATVYQIGTSHHLTSNHREKSGVFHREGFFALLPPTFCGPSRNTSSAMG